MDYGKFDPSVNRKRLNILRSRLVHIITLRSRVVVQNLTKIGYPILARQIGGSFNIFFLQAHNQTIISSRVQITNIEIC